ncbi:hypothetical protein BGZ79_001889 [Entomortierella chlamydospora]|nr:hypothetical protein BGZ79_001889 [Entomortierella chlamydospora]
MMYYDDVVVDTEDYFVIADYTVEHQRDGTGDCDCDVAGLGQESHVCFEGSIAADIVGVDVGVAAAVPVAVPVADVHYDVDGKADSDHGRADDEGTPIDLGVVDVDVDVDVEIDWSQQGVDCSKDSIDVEEQKKSRSEQMVVVERSQVHYRLATVLVSV